MKLFLYAAALAVSLTAAAAPGAPQKAPDARPNIVFLLTDDQRDNTFGAMGHPWVRTTHVDCLLGKAVGFTNTYIAEPACSPSRAAYFTGLRERVSGVGFTSRRR